MLIGVKRLVVLLALLVAGCGSAASSTVTSGSATVVTRPCVHYHYVVGPDGKRHRQPCPAPAPVASTTTSTTSTSASSAGGPQPSSCDWQKPDSSGCEQVPPAGACHFRHNGAVALPDAACTPGALNAAVSPGSVAQTICVKGYTAAIRPPVSYTGPLKGRLMQAYGLNPADAASYELDHLVPLEGGGAPSDPANLWPQPYSPAPGAHQKDDEENFLRSEACGGKAGLLPNLQGAIAADWLAAYQADNPPHITFGAGQ